MKEFMSIVEAFINFSDDIVRLLLSMIDIEDIVMLQSACKSMPYVLHTVLEQRCKEECLTTYSKSTISAYRMQVPVPNMWKKLYGSFATLHALKWTTCDPENTVISDALRTLKVDRQEYATDFQNQCLLRCGGHYWFNVWQAPLYAVELEKLKGKLHGIAPIPELDRAKGCDRNHENVIPFCHPLNAHSINITRWDRIHPMGTKPCPRRQFSITCIPNTRCNLSTLVLDEEHNEPGDKCPGFVKYPRNKSDSFHHALHLVNVRRVLIFGGQCDTLPYAAYNDLHLLALSSTTDRRPKRKWESVKEEHAFARWFQPIVAGTAPPPRANHVMTLLSPTLLLLSGGSEGGIPLRSMDIHCLHIEPDATGLGDYRWSRPLNVSMVPPGRAFHSVTKLSSKEVLIYGGHQLHNTSASIDVHHMRLTESAGYELATWKVADIAGSRPLPRRGHSTHVVGSKLIVFGGQKVTPTSESLGHPNAYGPLLNDIQILDITKRRWISPCIKSGKPPSARKGFKSQCFGTCILISSGFVASDASNKYEKRLPSSDIHVLNICSA